MGCGNLTVADFDTTANPSTTTLEPPRSDPASSRRPGQITRVRAAATAVEANSTMSPGTELDDLELAAWRAFLRTHARVARRLEADLMASSDLPLAEFDVLLQLLLAPGRKLRMNELADRVLLSRAGITRLVDRLVADGYVGRLKCASDARGAYAVLTERGAVRLEQARPGHMAGVRRYFLSSFSRPELATLAELLARTSSGE